MRGKVCLVTGGGSGIGRAAALKMAEEGRCGRSDRRAGAKPRSKRPQPSAEASGSQALAIKTDVTREDDVARLVETAVERYGRLDVAFNNAGFQERRVADRGTGQRGL